MSETIQKLCELRTQISCCDATTATQLPKATHSLIVEVLDAAPTCAYVVDCLPAISVSMNTLLRALGTFGRQPRSQGAIADARSDFLRMIDIFFDEVSLQLAPQSNVVFFRA